MTSTPQPTALPLHLDDLITAVDAAHTTPLDRVTGAMRLAEELGEAADSLLGHFVDRARRAGASWAEIGRSMGTSKQAAQQRFVTRSDTTRPPLDASQGFSRFTDQARSVVVGAQERARDASNDVITIAHLVLGLTAMADSTAARAVVASGVSVDAVQRTASATLPEPSATVPALIPFDAHTKAALQQSFVEAAERGADDVGTEHLLLAVLTVEDATGVLAGLGLTREAVEAFLTGDGREAPAPAGPALG
jgi:ClpA/ClpB-like protein